MTIETDPEVPPRYLAAPADLAGALGEPATDPNLLRTLRRISDRFRGAVGHQVTLTTGVVWYGSGDGGTGLALPGRPIIGTPLVEVDGRAVTDFATGRQAGVLRRDAGWPDGLENIKVTFDYGYEEIPTDIQDAVLEVAEIAANMSAGVENVTTGNESVKFANSFVNGGTTEQWTETVHKYAVNTPGSRS